MDNYFTHPSYLKIANKPVLAVYQWSKLCGQLGKTPDDVAKVLERVRDACRQKGFDGLWLLGRAGDRGPADSFDYAFSYLGGGRLSANSSSIATVSMGWNQEPWGRANGGSRHSPSEFKALCTQAREQMDKLPDSHLGRRLLLLDNWNEWGEGHYLAPHRQYGFGYLDAVREVFAQPSPEHRDIAPDDIGRGPYDRRYRTATGRQIQSEAGRERAE